MYVQGSQLIVAYDEHEVNNAFKFGVIHQMFGQVKYQMIWINILKFITMPFDPYFVSCVFCLCFSVLPLLGLSVLDIRGRIIWEQ